MKVIKTMGIDLAKSEFQIHAVDENGKVVFQKKVKRNKLLIEVAQHSPCLIGLEACAGAHFWAGKFEEFGNKVQLMAPQFVKPYVKTNKNDAADAEAICEAVRRPNMRFVSRKTPFHLEIQFIHRVRSRLIQQKVALINQARGFLTEYGIVYPVRAHNVQKQLADLSSHSLSAMAVELFENLRAELEDILRKISEMDQKIQRVLRENETAQRLQRLMGVGPITATAIVAAVPNAKDFKNGRQFSAWLGLVPKQHSSGGKTNLLGISKRGDPYIRSLLIHGARAQIQFAPKRKDCESLWIQKKLEQKSYNEVSVAMANKKARNIWAVLTKGENYKFAA